MTKQFKRGDRVRRINSHNCDEMRIGSEWTVSAVKDGWLAFVDYGGGAFNSDSVNFELVQKSYNVGDRVMNMADEDVGKWATGTVVEHGSCCPFVQWDRPSIYGIEWCGHANCFPARVEDLVPYEDQADLVTDGDPIPSEPMNLMVAEAISVLFDNGFIQYVTLQARRP